MEEFLFSFTHNTSLYECRCGGRFLPGLGGPLGQRAPASLPDPGTRSGHANIRTDSVLRSSWCHKALWLVVPAELFCLDQSDVVRAASLWEQAEAHHIDGQGVELVTSSDRAANPSRYRPGPQRSRETIRDDPEAAL